MAASDLNELEDKFLKNILIKKRKNVLFVGEGNFSFSFAFAILRARKYGASRCWDNVRVTRYESVSDTDPEPNLSRAKLICIKEIIRNFSDAKEIVTTIDMLTRLPDPRVECGVDACNLDRGLIPPAGGVIWFQCPWNAWNSGHTPGSLIRDFLVNTAGKLAEGVYVCIGITKHGDYFGRYNLKAILGKGLKAKDNSTEVLESYKFLGFDDYLIKKILKRGYRHEGVRDIHNYIYKDHLTLVFEKKLEPASSEDKESETTSNEDEESEDEPASTMAAMKLK